VKLERACIPLGAAFSTPFARWQGPLAGLSSLRLAEQAARRGLARSGIDPSELTELVLGWTVPQPEAFYGAPTVAARIGAPGISGPMIAQACATSVAAVQTAAAQIEAGKDGPVLALLTDRTSNGPHIVYPGLGSMGGAPASEDWVLENFRRDPWAEEAMIATSENVAREGGFSREQVDAVTVLRHEQYRLALENDREFQRRYMVSVEVPKGSGEIDVVDGDAGVRPAGPEVLAALRPSAEGGVTTGASQTHPADGAAGLVLTTEETARRLGRHGAIVRLLGAGMARAGKAQMPKAPVPAAQVALDDAEVGIDEVDLVTTHNPFAVNDLWFNRETGFDLERMNPYGSSLVYGHPQAPTGARAIAELIEALAARGGGTGLFTGCAAGDTGAALVVRVEG
jgi:acetyl-CoA acetyltransferase family protein